ncbi:MAG: SCO family protein [Desulfocapsaceae bacterium]|jgi:protein SCO1/2|nr:SCO family protein [Desulfocapsaceae bacterium]
MVLTNNDSRKPITPPRSTLLFLLILLTLPTGCSFDQKEPLPVIGTIDVPHTFTNQDGAPVSQAHFAGTVYVADFFFTSCPTICPVMKSQMLRIYESFTAQDNILLLSHTIDPEHDTVEVLHDYAKRLEISSTRWHMVTGPKHEIYDTAKRYMLAAMEDKKAPGGFIHSGSFCLVDQSGRIRGYYRGTEKESVDQLIVDIKRLLNEG